MEIGVESYKDAVMGSPIFFLTNLRNRICERISAESEKAELADYRFNCANTTAQSLISAISMIGQCILLVITLARGLIRNVQYIIWMKAHLLWMK